VGFIMGIMLVIIAFLAIFALLGSIYGKEKAQELLGCTWGTIVAVFWVLLAIPAVVIVIGWLSNAWNSNSEFHSTVVKWIGIGVMVGIVALVKWAINRAE